MVPPEEVQSRRLVCPTAIETVCAEETEVDVVPSAAAEETGVAEVA